MSEKQFIIVKKNTTCSRCNHFFEYVEQIFAGEVDPTKPKMARVDCPNCKTQVAVRLREDVL